MNGPTTPAPRRTQEERRASAQKRLLEATVSALTDLGYAATTTSEVSRRAGVSLGCQQNYFPSKTQLVVAAIEYLFQRRKDEIVTALKNVPQGDARSGKAIDLLWSLVNGDTFHAYLEVVVAARTDPELHVAVSRLADEFTEAALAEFRELFAAGETPDLWYETAYFFVFALLEGLAVGRIVSWKGDVPERVITVLKSISTSFGSVRSA